MAISSSLTQSGIASHMLRDTSATVSTLLHRDNQQVITTPPPPASTRSFTSTPRLPSHIAITPVTAATLPSFRRAISLILPIRYPNSFYTTILSESTTSSLSRAAIWYDRSRASKQKRDDRHVSAQQPTKAEPQVNPLENGELVGAIRCRLEPVPTPPSPGGSPKTEHQLYIQALALLSPYRGRGIATHLLETVINEALRMHADVSGVYAHVWEANEEGLDWYKRRGFVVEEPVIQNYYRRLKPAGARIVRRAIGVKDWLRAKEKAGAVLDHDELSTSTGISG
ncbi:hypothetical protein MMC26_004177 [Xylographa opegraphella]|nr:hypothetical protein [Xylographa opegraphella]